jgi:hypothetical protein
MSAMVDDYHRNHTEIADTFQDACALADAEEARRSLADTLEDRAIIVQLQRKPPGAKVERLRRRDNEWCAALRSQAARWSMDHFDKLVDPDPQMPEALNDRAADNWRPLLAIADLTGGNGLSWLAKPPSFSHARRRKAPLASSF